jgi:hypothetical protein
MDSFNFVSLTHNVIQMTSKQGTEQSMLGVFLMDAQFTQASKTRPLMPR